VKARKTGNGSGTITSSPRGITCPHRCSHGFAFGTTLTLKAKTSPGSAFAGWSGACTGRSRCKVKVNGHLAVTAKFTLRNCTVPNVRGETLAAARQTLKAHSCSTGKLKRAFSNTVQTGHVISESPRTGTHLKHNGKVSLTVSAGKKP
jgi:hypothetical protein